MWGRGVVCCLCVMQGWFYLGNGWKWSCICGASAWKDERRNKRKGVVGECNKRDELSSPKDWEFFFENVTLLNSCYFIFFCTTSD